MPSLLFGSFDPFTGFLLKVQTLYSGFGLSTCAAIISTSIMILAYNSQRKQAAPTSPAMSTSTSERTLPEPGQVTVSKILIHPIKSCRGIPLQSAHYTTEGLENDRLWCIIDAIKSKVITAREVPKMVVVAPSIEADGTLKVSFPKDAGCESFTIPIQPGKEILGTWTILPQITMWAGHPPMDGYICESMSGSKGTVSDILSKYFERPVHLVFKGPKPRSVDPTILFPNLQATAKYQDMYPLLILSEESTSAVELELRGHVGTQGIDERWKTDKVVVERFRPNIVLKGGGPFAEDDWEEISIGSGDAPAITLVSKCTRCLLPNVSPETGERDKAVPFKVLMKFRTGFDADPKNKMKPCVGCNAVPAADGTVRVGDIVYVRKVI